MAEQIKSTTTENVTEAEAITYKELMYIYKGKMSDAEKFDFLISAAICECRSVDMMKGFIRDGVCVNIPENPLDKDPASPLHMCVHEDFVEGVQVLVEAGAEVDIRWSNDLSAPTPLHYAIQCGNLRMVKELLRFGANPLCLLGGMMGEPPERKTFKWDCFDMSKMKIYSDDEMREFFRKYELFEEDKLKLSHLSWRREQDVQVEAYEPVAVCVKDKIFVCETWRFNVFPHVCVFSVVTRRWSKLRFYESRKIYATTLATTSNQVHTLGGVWNKNGKVEEEYSKVVCTLDCDSLQWSDNTLPPLNIGRKRATAASFEDMIIVAGGCGEGHRDLSSVEVLNSSQQSSTWWKIYDLPVVSYFMQCTVSDTDIFFGCGMGTDRVIYSCSLSAVKGEMFEGEGTSPELFWHALPETPLKWSGLAVVNNCLVTVGGRDDHDVSSSAVHLYNDYKKTWTKESDIKRSRWTPAVVFCNFENKNELFVFGGGGLDADTSVESCEVL